ncbi:MAG: PAS domain-containing protein [Lentisphaerota bacterium]
MDILRILAVEDNSADFRLLKEYLGEDPVSRFEILRAGTLKEALALLSGQDFAAVLLDLHLPDAEGLEVLEKVVAVKDSPPVVVLTGANDPGIGLRALSKKAQDFLAKGQIDSNTLIRSIRYAIERNKAEEAARRMSGELAKRAMDIQKANAALQASRLEAIKLMEDALEARNKAEKISVELARVSERLILAQQSAGAGTWDWDILAGKLDWSPELFRLFGLDPFTTQASFDAWLSFVLPEDRQTASDRIAQAMRNKTPLESEYRIRLPTREVRWINALGNTTYDNSGKPLRMSGICLDITERKRSEEVLRESQEDLNQAQAVAHAGSWRLDVQHNVLKWSDENHRIFGVPPGTPLTYETFLSAVHRDDQDAVHEQWAAALHGEPYDIEHRIIADGKIKWVHERARLEFDGNGQLLGGFGTTQDITEKKQAEDALRVSEARYRSYLEVTDQIGWTTDAGGLVADDMPVWRRYTGQSREEIQGWGWLNAIHPEDQERTSREWQEAVRKKRNYETEYRIRRHDGAYRLFLARGVPALNAEGGILEWVGTCIDITERKRAEEVLLDVIVQRQSAQYTRTLIEVSIDPLVTISMDGKITDVNDATIKATGVSRDKLIGTDFSSYFTEPEKARDVYRQVFAEGFVMDYPLTIRRQDGRLMYVLFNASVYKDTHGKVAGVFAAARDVTAQKESEAERERYQQRLRDLTERLASTEERERRRIAIQIHDTVIQTLSLSNIKLGGLRKALSDAELADRVEEVNHVRSLLEEAIKESRSLMGELAPPLLYELGLVPALRDLAERLEKLHRIPIHVHDDGLAKPIDKKNCGSLFESARELILNALKHAGPCTINLYLSKDDGYFCICVEDSGAGFEVPEDGRFAFHRQGGFGLFSVRERLDRIGGRLSITSQVGCGTKATIHALLDRKP